MGISLNLFCKISILLALIVYQVEFFSVKMEKLFVFDLLQLLCALDLMNRLSELVDTRVVSVGCCLKHESLQVKLIII